MWQAIMRDSTPQRSVRTFAVDTKMTGSHIRLPVVCFYRPGSCFFLVKKSYKRIGLLFSNPRSGSKRHNENSLFVIADYAIDDPPCLECCAI